MSSFLKQPRAVWAVAFACVIAFMGIGLVDPILKEIAAKLDATPSQVSLLFTSYMAIMGVSMLVTGVVSSRIGPKRTLLSGLVLIIVFAGLAGMSGSVGAVVGFRAGWGLGNALFVATALSTIVSASDRRLPNSSVPRRRSKGCPTLTGSHRASACRSTLPNTAASGRGSPDHASPQRAHRPVSTRPSHCLLPFLSRAVCRQVWPAAW